MSQRGDVIAPALPGANVAFGGVMGQGKSNAARVVMAGAALDPLAELWVFVFANNGDFDAYRPRLARYHRGVDETTVLAALDSLWALYEEVGRREARLAELNAKKVTRPLAEKHPDLRPLISLFSECHELFSDPTHGREAADLAVQTMRRARKTAITLAFDTQSSRADAIPPKILPGLPMRHQQPDGMRIDGDLSRLASLGLLLLQPGLRLRVAASDGQ